MAKLSRDDLSEQQCELLDWLLTNPKDREENQAKLARRLGVAPRTLRDWKQNETFYTVWQKEARRIGGGPERSQQALDALHQIFMDDDGAKPSDRVAAAKEFLRHAEAISPPEEVDRPKTVEEMSLEELNALIAEEASRRKAELELSDAE